MRSLFLFIALLLPVFTVAKEPVRLSIACGALGVELRLCKRAVHEWERATGHRVSIVTTPSASNDRLALYLQMLASRSESIDVLQIDVVWPGLLANHLADLRPLLGEDIDSHFPILMTNDTIDGRLVALPWWADVGVLYYRRDLLAQYGFTTPRTWRELTHIARTIQLAENAKRSTPMWGFVFQGRSYEGLTCNALEWVVSHGGAAILTESGDIAVDGNSTRRALELAASWIGNIAPPGVLNYDEETSRGVFQTGNAVFMRNWPYAWALAQSPDSPIKGLVGVSPLPRGDSTERGRHAGTLGGWHLAVSRYSRHPREAAELVRFLTGRAEQKRRAIEAAYNPTIPDLYRDPEVLAANPFFGEILPSLEAATARPARVAGPHYNRLSSDFWRAVHDILAGEDSTERIAQLKDDLDRLRHRARW